jgi:hypothetical protein
MREPVCFIVHRESGRRFAEFDLSRAAIIRRIQGRWQQINARLISGQAKVVFWKSALESAGSSRIAVRYSLHFHIEIRIATSGSNDNEPAPLIVRLSCILQSHAHSAV